MLREYKDDKLQDDSGEMHIGDAILLSDSTTGIVIEIIDLDIKYNVMFRNLEKRCFETRI